MIVSTTFHNERDELIRVEVETTDGDDDVAVRVGPASDPSDGLAIMLTRRECYKLRTCLSDVIES